MSYLLQMISPVNYINIVGLATVMFVLFFETLQLSKDDKNRLWSVPITVWMIHSAIFYSVFLYNSISGYAPSAFFYGWASIVRLHGYFTIVSLEFIRWRLHIIKYRVGK
jgi:hypothetical protein